MSTPGNKPEEIARDFTKAYYRYFRYGVCWYETHQAHKFKTAFFAKKKDRTKNTPVTTTPGIIPSVIVKPAEYISGKENSLVLVDTLNGKNELVNVAYLNRDVPNLYPIVGVPKGIPAGIAIPPPVPLDLPPLGGIKRYRHLHVDRFQQQQSSSRRQHATVANQSIPLTQQFTSHDHNDHPLELSDPPSIIQRAAQFYHAGDYRMMIKILEVLDRHLMLSDEIAMAREFGQGLAHFKKYHAHERNTYTKQKRLS